MKTLAVLLSLLSFHSFSAQAKDTVVLENESYRILKLGKSSYSIMVKADQFEDMGCNSGFVVGKNSVVLFDTHISETAMKKVMLDIATLTDKPISHAINSHFHSDHVQGNGALSESTRILSHKNSLEQFSVKEGREFTHPGKGVRPPDRGIEEDEVLSDAKLKVLAIGKAHSVGDLAAYQEEDKVLFLGDVYVNGYIGFLKEGHLNQWISSLEKLKSLDVMSVVPGHGPMAAFTGVVDYQTYLQDFVATTSAHFEEHGKEEGYELPTKYNHLGARFFLEGNIARAFELWKQDRL